MIFNTGLFVKINISGLQDESSRAVHEEYDPKAHDLEFVDLTYLEKVVLNGVVEKFRDTLTFHGNLTSRIQHVCARCLSQVEEGIDLPFQMVYEVQGKDEIDTTEDIREMLILDHPIKFLCTENCLGLCSVCGANLNSGPCKCAAPSN